MTDFYKKYLKYKTKYINYKNKIENKKGGHISNNLLNKIENQKGKLNSYKMTNQKGGLNLSGPTNVNYYFNGFNKKKIIVIGDLHYDKNFICDDKNDTLDIDKYFEYLLDDSTNIKVDFFIEDSIPDKDDLINGNLDFYPDDDETDYLSRVRNILKKNYKKNENKKIHFTDIRDKIYNMDTFVSFSHLLESEFLENIIEVKQNYNFLKILQSYSSDLIINLNIFLENAEKIFKDDNHVFADSSYQFRFLFKEMDRFTNKNILKILLNITIYHINQFLSEIDEKNFASFSKKNIERIGNIFDLGMRAVSYINDLYTVLRIIKNDDITNSIIYTGQKHTYCINEYLSKIGFGIVEQTISTADEIRCVKNVFKFEDFFNIV
jgi:hypothetical protein